MRRLRILSAIIVFLILIPIFAALTPKVRAQVAASETMIFKDDFESYPVGSFLSNGTMGDWLLVWGAHAGDFPAQAFISNDYAHSGNQSLEGKSFNSTRGHCGAVIRRDCPTLSDLIGYEAYVMCLPGGGCDVGLFNQYIVTWGRMYAVVTFESSYIWAGGNKLQPFTSNDWYKVRVILNRNTRVFDVWVNDVLEGRNITEPNDPWQISSICCEVGFNFLVPAYFDDVKTFTVSDTATPRALLDFSASSSEQLLLSTLLLACLSSFFIVAGTVRRGKRSNP